jgi:hypothetical protein
MSFRLVCVGNTGDDGEKLQLLNREGHKEHVWVKNKKHAGLRVFCKNPDKSLLCQLQL